MNPEFASSSTLLRGQYIVAGNALIGDKVYLLFSECFPEIPASLPEEEDSCLKGFFA